MRLGDIINDTLKSNEEPHRKRWGILQLNPDMTLDEFLKGMQKIHTQPCR